MGVFDVLAAVEQKYGLPSGYLARTRQIESGGGVNTYNAKSGAAGDFQFIPSTAKQYGLTDPYNLDMAADAAGRFTRDNMNVLQAKLGRAPTPAELYLAHQQGAGGASKLLASPDMPAGQVVGQKAVAWNGGDPNAPASAFANKWMAKFDGTTAKDGPVTASAAPADKPAAKPDGTDAKINWAGLLSSLNDTQQQSAAPAMAAPTLDAGDPAVLVDIMRRRPRGLL